MGTVNYLKLHVDGSATIRFNSGEEETIPANNVLKKDLINEMNRKKQLEKANKLVKTQFYR